MKSRALVLGGGGAAGNAWLIGVIAGLADEGVDISQADLIIGTSAGSTAAAQISSARAAELLADIRAEPAFSRLEPGKPDRAGDLTRLGSNLMDATGAVIGAATDPADMRRRMGAALVDMAGPPDSPRHSQRRATVAARLPSPAWPEGQMLITAVEASSGQPVIFDRRSGVKLVDAVAASTAGGFAYRIGEKFYIDGAYRSDVNADLAAGYDRVLIIPPLGAKTRKPPEWRLHLAAEVADLRAHGTSVETILPDSNSESAIGIGMNLMDLSARQPSCEAGYRQGRALADRLGRFWV